MSWLFAEFTPEEEARIEAMLEEENRRRAAGEGRPTEPPAAKGKTKPAAPRKRRTPAKEKKP